MLRKPLTIAVLLFLAFGLAFAFLAVRGSARGRPEFPSENYAFARVAGGLAENLDKPHHDQVTRGRLQ